MHVADRIKTTMVKSRCKVYSGLIEALEPHEIFVFGSNPEGRHGLGTARIARNFYGAIYGQGRGLQGQSYGLVTTNLRAGFFEPATGLTYNSSGERSVPKSWLRNNISELYDFARARPKHDFLVAFTAGGRCLNGYTDQEMAEMFACDEIPLNVIFEDAFRALIERHL